MNRLLPFLFVAIGLGAVIALLLAATRLEAWPANLRPGELRKAMSRGGSDAESAEPTDEASDTD